MKKKVQFKFFTILLLGFIGIFSSAVIAQNYTDVEGSFAKEAIKTWSERAVIQGYEGKFRPNSGVTRGELAVILNRILGYPRLQADKTLFSDVENAFYTEALLSLNEQGIIKGSGNQLRPKDKVSREEAAVILARAFQLSGQSSKTFFSDSAKISPWAEQSMAIMAEKGFMKGYNNKVNPKKTLTRAELVQLLSNMISVYISQSGEYDSRDFGDLKENGLIIIKAAQVKIKNLATTQSLLVMADSGNGALHLENTELGAFQVLKRQEPMPVLLEKSKVEKIHWYSNHVKLFADKESRVAGKVFPAEELEKGKRELRDLGIFFRNEKQPNLSDEYKPILPDSNSSNSNDTNENTMPKEKEKFLPVLDGLASNGILYKKSGENFALPSRVAILLHKNGENTGKEIEVSWIASDLEKIQKGERGNYDIMLKAQEDVVINSVNYGQVEIQLQIVIK